MSTSPHGNNCIYRGEGDWVCSVEHRERDRVTALEQALAHERGLREAAEAERDAEKFNKEFAQGQVGELSKATLTNIDTINSLRDKLEAAEAALKLATDALEQAQKGPGARRQDDDAAGAGG